MLRMSPLAGRSLSCLYACHLCLRAHVGVDDTLESLRFANSLQMTLTPQKSTKKGHLSMTMYLRTVVLHEIVLLSLR